jgi:GMP synthase (glutamine-hydrolysing)
MATQFHPEVVHTPDGAKLIANFVRHVCGLPATGRWPNSAPPRSPRSARRSATSAVICGLSGGVDSAVAAVLIHEAIGDQLTCVFVDHGLLRMNEARSGRQPVPRPLQYPARPCERRGRFIDGLAGVTDPKKRKFIGGDVHRCVRGGSEEDRRRRFPRAGHALPRRDRERQLHRRPE